MSPAADGAVAGARASGPGWWATLARLGASWSGRIGGAIALLLLAVAAVGPALYPVDPYRMAVGQRLRSILTSARSTPTPARNCGASSFPLLRSRRR